MVIRNLIVITVLILLAVSQYQLYELKKETNEIKSLISELSKEATMTKYFVMDTYDTVQNINR